MRVGLAVQPAPKVRGREHLRIICGAEYTDPANLERLRPRGLSTKRGLALKEFALYSRPRAAPAMLPPPSAADGESVGGARASGNESSCESRTEALIQGVSAHE